MLREVFKNKKQIKSAGIDTETKDMLKALNLLYLRIFSVSFLVDAIIAFMLFFLIKSVPLFIVAVLIIILLNTICNKEVSKSTEKICNIYKKKWNLLFIFSKKVFSRN